MIARFSHILLCCVGCLSCAEAPQSKYELKGFWHPVETADSARSLAARYGADADAIAELNDLQRGETITGRREVFIPKRGGVRPGASPATASPRRPGKIAGKRTERDRPKTDLARSQPAEAQKKSARCTQNGFGCLKWPVKGKIVSLFGKKGTRHHDGIDVLAEKGTPVLAAREGKVLYSGNDIKGYGNLIILRHAGGVLSIYAHNDVNLVSEGDQVEEGEAVARVGQSGSATRPCLHFEVRVGEQPRDPLLYLP